MSSIRALRASAWTLMILGALHLASHLRTATEFVRPSDEKTRLLVTAMSAYLVPDFPIARSMAKIYLGLSLVFAAVSLLFGGIMVMTAKALADQPQKLRPIARVYVAGLLVLTVISMNYFIWPPTVCLLVSFGLAALALARLRKA